MDSVVVATIGLLVLAGLILIAVLDPRPPRKPRGDHEKRSRKD